jgi:hypothetical protein
MGFFHKLRVLVWGEAPATEMERKVGSSKIHVAKTQLIMAVAPPQDRLLHHVLLLYQLLL